MIPIDKYTYKDIYKIIKEKMKIKIFNLNY